MAPNHFGRSRRLRYPTLFLVAISFIISAVFLSYIRLDPTTSNEPNELNTNNNAMSTTTSKHHKDKTEKTYPQISSLPTSLLPTTPSTPEETSRRLIILGDVHGHLEALETLLQKAEFSESRDTVILAGDIVNKGPDSAGIVDLAMRIGAYGVRGNHDDRVLRAWEHHESKKARREQDRARGVDHDSDMDNEEEEEEDENVKADSRPDIKDSGTTTDAGEMADESQGSSLEETSEDEKGGVKTQSHKKQKKKKGKNKEKKKKGKGSKHYAGDLATAKSLKPEHRAWLSALPLILRVGDLGPRYGEVLVVHAGLVPGIPLENQDPEAVMNMRTLLSPSSRAHTTTDNLHEPSLTDPVQQAQSQSEYGRNHDNNQAEEKKFKPLIPSPAREGTPWAKIWTSYQASTILSRPHARPTTVVYGHDAKSGLQLRRYTFGLDSGCGSDNVLTGVIFEIPSAAHTNDDSNNDSDSGDGYQMKEEVEEGEEGEAGGEGREGEEGRLDTGTTSQDQESREQRSRPKIRHRLVSVPCA
ncbi:Metallo-dependent phosphatase [Xylaria sp. FL0064]|nr:Metallo-dependent phosphatase [Xylaria sp. FL0064]